MRLEDKTAVVTGAGSGIGLAIARLFVAEGAKVVPVDWHAEAVDAAVAEIGGVIVGMTGNVADKADSVAMVDQAVAEYGRLDILVNNAGVMDLFESVAGVTNETWRRCMSVNVDGPMYAMRRAVPLMLAQGSGSIVNIIGCSHGGGAAGAAYTASKHASIGLTKSTGYQYAKLGIRCNALAVGVVNTNIIDSVKDSTVDQSALARIGVYHASNSGTLEPVDIANAVLFLASDDARHLNGAVLPVDMGWSAA